MNGSFGKYRGFVEDNQDPSNLGRLRVRVPKLLGDESMWAVPCVPYAGSGSGFFMLPEPGSGVWVEFEEGDLSRPIWSGCWWAPGQVPPDHGGADPGPQIKLIRTESGLLIELDDAHQRILLSDKLGTNQVIIDVQAGQVKIKGDSRITVEAPQVELGTQVGQPVMLGGELLQYLNQLVALYNSHLHPGEIANNAPVTPAPPVPPLPPAGPGLLSKVVRTG